ncbi:MAG: topoisomerase DNA-binding C4 zinc finger domain-containing protein [Eubacterium sp.]|nr:topoisomerase DNA-binding C4 zinc finger domain-containing protein [Eubacterium sp.]MBR7072946.1 topoisomerase DNA-binding C4 zinc finger domain-containing protein [Eubacterium sp.]
MTVLKRKRMEGAGKIRTAGINKTFENYTKPLVVLANKKTVINDRYAPKDIKNKVIRADNLVATIKKMCTESKLTENSRKVMLQDAEYVLSFHSENRTDYVAKFREEIKKQNEPQDYGLCPWCCNDLVKRRNKATGEVFIGCSNFPKCRYIRKITKKGE